MKFAFIFIGFLYGFFAIGRLLWPNPDGTLDQKNQASLDELRLKASEKGGVGFVFKLFYPIVILYFFPFHRPFAGLVVATAMIVIGFLI